MMLVFFAPPISLQGSGFSAKDTMAYTASALSFMLEQLDKPVVLTGELGRTRVARLLGWTPQAKWSNGVPFGFPFKPQRRSVGEMAGVLVSL